MKRLTTEDFIKKANTVHSNKYDYSKVKYVDAKTKVCIICPEHGEFWQIAGNHLFGQDCPKCGKKISSESKKTGKENFVRRSKKIHGNKYDYSKVEYMDSKTKVCIICPEHGEFLQTPSSHLQGCGCKKCATEKTHNLLKKTLDNFIKKCKEIHGNKYDYSKVKYVDAKTKVCIVCPKHGEFWQTPDSHLQGHGCKKCCMEKLFNLTRMTKEEFIKKSKEMHGNKYDYSKTDYKNCDTDVCIICPEHGEFWQKPYYHIHKGGCPHCKESKLEKEVCKLLASNKIIFDRQKKFDWLGRQSLDFYLPDYNIAIECQGRQHFEPVNYFGGKKAFEYVKQLDKTKKELCEKNHIDLLYFSDKKWGENIILSEEMLLEKISRKS